VIIDYQQLLRFPGDIDRSRPSDAGESFVAQFFRARRHWHHASQVKSKYFSQSGTGYHATEMRSRVTDFPDFAHRELAGFRA
jgi:hypothetical protein